MGPLMQRNAIMQNASANACAISRQTGRAEPCRIMESRTVVHRSSTWLVRLQSAIDVALITSGLDPRQVANAPTRNADLPLDRCAHLRVMSKSGSAPERPGQRISSSTLVPGRSATPRPWSHPPTLDCLTRLCLWGITISSCSCFTRECRSGLGFVGACRGVLAKRGEERGETTLLAVELIDRVELSPIAPWGNGLLGSIPIHYVFDLSKFCVGGHHTRIQAGIPVQSARVQVA